MLNNETETIRTIAALGGPTQARTRRRDSEYLEETMKTRNSIMRLLAAAVILLRLSPSPASAAGPFTFTTIDVPGSADTGAAGINAAGQIVGGYTDASGSVHGFLLDNGSFTTIDIQGARGTGAGGINEAGKIVGGYTNASGTDHGFLIDNGTFTTIDPPGDTFSF